jgi:hypothetical protein
LGLRAVFFALQSPLAALGAVIDMTRLSATSVLASHGGGLLSLWTIKRPGGDTASAAPGAGVSLALSRVLDVVSLPVTRLATAGVGGSPAGVGLAAAPDGRVAALAGVRFVKCWAAHNSPITAIAGGGGGIGVTGSREGTVRSVTRFFGFVLICFSLFWLFFFFATHFF